MSDETTPVEIVDEKKTSHPSEQWYRIYAYTPGVVSEAEWATPPSWGPVDGVLHVHHPDAYHPDPTVCITHHRNILKEGSKLAACGAAHDPRMIFVEDHDEADRCPDCVAATAAAEDVHEKAKRIILEKGIAELHKQLATEEAALAAQKPIFVAPEAVDEALVETIPETLGELDEEEPL